jgi:hypothetical protein
MKSLLLLPLVEITCLGSATALLAVCGARFAMIDPVVAGAIGIAAGLAGLSPILAGRRKDAVGIFQLALVGTVLHLFVTVGLMATALAAHLVSASIGFMGWLMAGYWLSLITLVWQLRRVLVATGNLTKVHP